MARVEPRTFSLETLIEEVRGGVLRVPRFQRGFVWRRDQVLGLLESVRMSHPVGSLLVWRTPDRPTCFPRVGPISIPPDEPASPAPVGFVLDGHQRLATLFGTLSLTEEQAEGLTGSDRIFLTYLDLEKGHFVHARHPEPHLLPARYLLRKDGSIRAHLRKHQKGATPDSAEWATWDRYQDRALDVQTAFFQYKLPYIDIVDAPRETAVEIFYKVNSQGSPVTRAEAFAALSYRENTFDFTGFARDLLEAHPEYSNFGLEPVLRCLLASLGETIYATDWDRILQAHQATLPEMSAQVQTAFAGAVRFLENEVRASSGRVVPYALQLVMLTEFHRLCPNPTEAQKRALVQWFWASSFSGAYTVGSALAFDQAVQRARHLATTGEGTLLEGQERMRPMPRRFHPKSARVRAFHLFLAALRPLDLVTGVPLQSPLKDGMASATPIVQGQDGRWLLANRMLAGSQKRNVRELLLDVPQKICGNQILASHCVPMDALEALRAGEVKRFLDLRERELVLRERAFAAQFLEAQPESPADPEVEDEPEVDVEEWPESDFR